MSLKEKIATFTDALLSKHAQKWRSEESMERLGIERIMRLAKRYNRWRYSDPAASYQSKFDHELDSLFAERGGFHNQPPRIVLKDGWAIDTSGTLPHLDRLLKEAGEVVAERGGKVHSDVQRPYFRNLMFYEDLAKYPSWLDFATSPEVLATVTEYLGTMPVLSKTRPPGVRFMEWNRIRILTRIRREISDTVSSIISTCTIHRSSTSLF
jgi:hypothetical protein